MRNRLVVSIVSSLVLVSAAAAAEGKIPVLSLAGPPYTITAPGHYILTRNVDSPGNAAIKIFSEDVTLDLGGHTVTGPGSYVAAAIEVAPGSGAKLVTVRNGRIVSGSQGISALGSAASLRFEGLDVSGSIAGIGASGDHVEVIDCSVHDLVTPFGSAGAGIGLDAVGGRVTGNLIQNVPGSGISIRGFHGGEIRRNIVRNYGSGASGANGIYLEEPFVGGGAGGNILADNTVDGPGVVTDDVGMLIQSPNNLIVANNINGNGSFGILIRGNYNRIERNVTNLNGSDGIQVRFALGGNRLAGNQSQLNKGCGLNITTTANTVYSDNTLTGNSGGNVCGVAVNAGGNYCDAVVCP